jgi:hypothetical protein
MRGSISVARLWEMAAGELKAVEQDAGAVRVELVGGDAMHDLAERVVECGLILWEDDGESSAGVACGGRLAGGVVEVAVGFSTESR